MKQRTLKEQLDSFAKTVGSWNSRKDVEFRTVKAAAKHLAKAYEDLQKEMAEVTQHMLDFYDDRSDITIPMDDCRDTMYMFYRSIWRILGPMQYLSPEEMRELNRLNGIETPEEK